MASFLGVKINWKLKLLTICIALLGFQEFYQGWKENRKFDKGGVTVLVTPPQELRVTQREKPGSLHYKEDIYTANLSFKTEAGEDVVVEMRLPEEIVAKFKRKQDVSIQYVKSEPGLVRWPGESRDVKLGLFVFFFAGCCAYFMLTDKHSR